ncbi:MAG: hypothetical protein ABSF90_13260 [Syntrophobacteraceae bacterium]|jgi:hypothetical protein
MKKEAPVGKILKAAHASVIPAGPAPEVSSPGAGIWTLFNLLILKQKVSDVLMHASVLNLQQHAW